MNMEAWGASPAMAAGKKRKRADKKAAAAAAAAAAEAAPLPLQFPGSPYFPSMMNHSMHQQPTAFMFQQPNMLSWGGGVPCIGTVAGQVGTVTGQVHEKKKAELNPLDADWSHKTLLGGSTKTTALDLPQRALLLHMALDRKISRGTLNGWKGVSFDAAFFLLYEVDPGSLSLKSLTRTVTPRCILEQLEITQSEVHKTPEALQAIKDVIVANARNQGNLLDLALDAGMSPTEETPSKKAQTDYRGYNGTRNEARGGESCGRPLEILQPEVDRMQKRLQMAELAKEIAKAEFEIQKYKGAGAKVNVGSDTSSTRSSTASEPSQTPTSAGADSSASPASAVSTPYDEGISLAAAALEKRTKLLNGEQAKEESRKAKLQALVANMVKKQASAAAQQPQIQTAMVAGRAAELANAAAATRELQQAPAGMAEEDKSAKLAEEAEAAKLAKAVATAGALEHAPPAMTEEDKAAKLAEEAEAEELANAALAATGALQQAPTDMTEEEEAAKLTEEAEAAELANATLANASALLQGSVAMTEEEEAAKLAEEAEAEEMANAALAATGALQQALAGMTEEEAAKLAAAEASVACA